MTLVFANPIDLCKCATSLDATYADCAVGTLATDGDDTVVCDIFIQEKKVQVVTDWRTFQDLKHLFPMIDSETMQTVWAKQSSWEACRDVLSSIASSHSVLKIPTDSDWPSLPTSHLRAGRLPQETAQPVVPAESVDGHDTGSDWSFVRIGEEDDESASLCESEGSWAVVETQQEARPRTRRHHRTYREAVLAAPKRRGGDCKVVTAAAKKPIKWRPQIVVTPIRINQTFVFAVSSFPFSGYDDEEEEALWDICCAGTGFYSSAVPAKRQNDAAKMRPQALSKKLARIALKGH